MSPSAKVRWMMALKSNKYKKGRRALRTSDHFCAIGVLCDIARPDSWKIIHSSHYLPNGDRAHQSYYQNIVEVLHETQVPIEVMNIITMMNDLEDKSFDEIAEWIGQNL